MQARTVSFGVFKIRDESVSHDLSLKTKVLPTFGVDLGEDGVDVLYRKIDQGSSVGWDVTLRIYGGAGRAVGGMYTHSEHLQKNAEVKKRRDCDPWCGCDFP